MLLILAGVSISLLLDENGIIKKSKDARREYEQAKANEQEDLSNLSDMIDEATAEPLQKVLVNTRATANGTINGEKGNSSNPLIPEGYTPIDTDTSEWGDGTSSPTQDSVDHGLVIRDDSNNEWVWVPVDSTTFSKMTETSAEAKTLYNTTVTTNIYSKTITIGKDNKQEVTRTSPGEKTNNDLTAEPELTGDDFNKEYYQDILGFESVEDMAQTFVNEYIEMINSIHKYGGFYIGSHVVAHEVSCLIVSDAEP